MAQLALMLDRPTLAGSDADPDFDLEFRVIEAAEPVAGLLRSTSDNCGSTCPGACTSRMSDPA
jgi:FxLD family lantipeptide